MYIFEEEEEKAENGPTIKFLGVVEDNFDNVKRQGSILHNTNHVHKLNKDSSKGVIGIGHDNWNLVLHMIFGVSKSVRNSLQEEAFEINNEDFNRKYCHI